MAASRLNSPRFSFVLIRQSREQRQAFGPGDFGFGNADFGFPDLLVRRATEQELQWQQEIPNSKSVIPKSQNCSIFFVIMTLVFQIDRLL